MIYLFLPLVIFSSLKSTCLFTIGSNFQKHSFSRIFLVRILSAFLCHVKKSCANRTNKFHQYRSLLSGRHYKSNYLRATASTNIPKFWQLSITSNVFLVELYFKNLRTIFDVISSGTFFLLYLVAKSQRSFFLSRT